MRLDNSALHRDTELLRIATMPAQQKQQQLMMEQIQHSQHRSEAAQTWHSIQRSLYRICEASLSQVARGPPVQRLLIVPAGRAGLRLQMHSKQGMTGTASAMSYIAAEACSVMGS